MKRHEQQKIVSMPRYVAQSIVVIVVMCALFGYYASGSIGVLGTPKASKLILLCMGAGTVIGCIVTIKNYIQFLKPMNRLSIGIAETNTKLQEEIAKGQEIKQILVENEEKFRAIYEGSHDAIMLLDEKGFFDGNRRSTQFTEGIPWGFQHPVVLLLIRKSLMHFWS